MKKNLFFSIVFLAGLAGLFVFLSNQPAHAAQSSGHTDCLNCHTDGLVGQFPNGDTIALSFDVDAFSASKHGTKVGCLACHPNEAEYPHANSPSGNCSACHTGQGGGQARQVQLGQANQREIVFQVVANCSKCHAEIAAQTADGMHERVLKAGNPNAPVCTDCHGSHNIAMPNEPRTRISQTCAQCHAATYSTYRTSVHGAALESEGNTDVPTCEDCHGAHNVRGPHTLNFRDEMMNTCSQCHADEAKMGKYGITTDVFQTYLNDFHGRTVDSARFDRSGRPSEAATCYDCHGYHNIRKVDDPLSTVYPENLQRTCQQCHAEADIRFPQAWLSHYVPTWEQTPALYVVNQVYGIFIPTLIGGFVVYIGLDARRRIADRFKHKK